MDIITEWWTVNGSLLPTPPTFYREEDAIKEYERICRDDWVDTASVTHHEVIRRQNKKIVLSPTPGED